MILDLLQITFSLVTGLTPKSGDYFLVEHRDGLPDFCK